MQELAHVLEKLTLALEDNMDYPVESVLPGGSTIVNTSVKGRADAVLVVTMKEFKVAMVRSTELARARCDFIGACQCGCLFGAGMGDLNQPWMWHHGCGCFLSLDRCQFGNVMRLRCW